LTEKSPFTGLPSASVIVPTHSRRESLRRCLEALATLDYPRDLFEVVVVDDGEQELEALVAPYAERVELKLIAGPGRGPALARNAGIAGASGELLAFTDDDCAPDPGWLAALARAVGDRERIAGGRTVNGLTRNSYSAASQAINDAVYEHYNADPAHALFLASNNMAGPASAFERLGGFDGRFSLAAGEDRDLCTRWLEQGGELYFEQAAIVEHFHQLGLGGFWRQHFGYGRGTYLQRRFRAERGSGFELAPAATSGILGASVKRAFRERSPVRLFLLGVWQTANLFGFARQSLARKPRGQGGE
jgi:GT2 family glycosyltransferase